MRRIFIKSVLATAMMSCGLAHAQSPVEIVVDYAFASIFNDVHKEIADAFMKKFPQYKIIFRAPTNSYEEAAEKALRQSVTNQTADVSYQGLNRVRVLVDRGIAVEMTPFIQSEKNWDQAGYDNALLSLGQINGKQYGIGFSLSTPIIYYNADLLRKAGITPDKFPTTWEGILAVGKRAQQATPKTDSIYIDWAVTGNWMWQTLIFSNGGSMLTKDEKKVAFDGPAGQEAIHILDDAVKKAGMPNISYEAASQNFVVGNLAIMATTTSRLGSITQQIGKKFDLRTAKTPIKNNGRLPAGGNVAMILTKDPAKQKAAWEYIKFATGPIGATYMVKSTGYFPANTIPANDPKLLKPFYESHPNHLTAIEQLPVLTGWYAFPGNNGLKITDVMTDHLQSVVSQETAPDKALQNMSRDVQALLPR